MILFKVICLNSRVIMFREEILRIRIVIVFIWKIYEDDIYLKVIKKI